MVTMVKNYLLLISKWAGLVGLVILNKYVKFELNAIIKLS